MSDYNCIDVIREAQATVVAAAQSSTSFIPPLGREKARVFTLNLRNRLIFKAADEEGALESADFLGKKRVIKKSWGYTGGKMSRNFSEQEEHKIKPHILRSLPKHTAVVIHCAMHTFRSAKIDDWREFLGVTSRHHEHQSHYPVAVLDKDNPITQAIPADYKTPMDELYIVEKVWPNTKILATTKSEKTGDVQPVFWTNQFGKARVFGTTYGHSNDTFSDNVFLTTLVRGIAWAASRDVKTGEPK
jgi:hypothetical protein